MSLTNLEPMKTPFALSLQEILAPTIAKDPLHALRTQARRKFEEIGLPDRKEEAFQYFPLRSFYEGTPHLLHPSSVFEEDLIQRHMAPECCNSCVVFVDGQFRQELSSLDKLDKRVGLFTLEEGMKTFGHFLNARFAKHLKEEKDPFALLNLAVHLCGAFLYIPPKVVLEHPIQVLHVVTQEKALIAPRLQLFLGAHAEAKLYTRTCAPDFQEGLTLDLFDIALEEGARLEHIATACRRTSGWSMEFVRATLKKDSRLGLNQIVKNIVGYRRDIKVDLLGENASTTIKGLGLLSDKENAHTRVVVNHEAPYTHSSQHFKTALLDNSQSSFEGKIAVQRPAQKTEAYQLCNHLILGDHAIANAKPNLEIFADDVKASHGATVAQLKEEELFYLKSRGISLHEAKNLLIEGFCQEIASSIFLRSLHDELSNFIKRYANN